MVAAFFNVLPSFWQRLYRTKQQKYTDTRAQWTDVLWHDSLLCSNRNFDFQHTHLYIESKSLHKNATFTVGFCKWSACGYRVKTQIVCDRTIFTNNYKSNGKCKASEKKHKKRSRAIANKMRQIYIYVYKSVSIICIFYITWRICLAIFK